MAKIVINDKEIEIYSNSLKKILNGLSIENLSKLSAKEDSVYINTNNLNELYSVIKKITKIYGIMLAEIMSTYDNDVKISWNSEISQYIDNKFKLASFFVKKSNYDAAVNSLMQLLDKLSKFEQEIIKKEKEQDSDKIIGGKNDR